MTVRVSPRAGSGVTVAKSTGSVQVAAIPTWPVSASSLSVARWGAVSATVSASPGFSTTTLRLPSTVQAKLAAAAGVRASSRWITPT